MMLSASGASKEGPGPTGRTATMPAWGGACAVPQRRVGQQRPLPTPPYSLPPMPALRTLEQCQDLTCYGDLCLRSARRDALCMQAWARHIGEGPTFAQAQAQEEVAA